MRLTVSTRIRLGSLEPGIITESFVQALVKLPKVCPHFHLSLQSGSGYCVETDESQYTRRKNIWKNADLLRQYYEHPAITTDIIVGFPGGDTGRV